MKKIIFFFILFLPGSFCLFCESYSEKSQYVLVNPIFIPAGTINLEYERQAFAPAVSMGVSAWHEYLDVKARWYYAKGLYYFSGTALKGLGAGPLIGTIWSKKGDDFGLMAGLILQYNLAFGRDKRGMVGAGAAVRGNSLTGDAGKALGNIDGEVRLGIGYRF